MPACPWIRVIIITFVTVCICIAGVCWHILERQNEAIRAIMSGGEECLPPMHGHWET